MSVFYRLRYYRDVKIIRKEGLGRKRRIRFCAMYERKQLNKTEWKEMDCASLNANDVNCEWRTYNSHAGVWWGGWGEGSVVLKEGRGGKVTYWPSYAGARTKQRVLLVLRAESALSFNVVSNPIDNHIFHFRSESHHAPLQDSWSSHLVAGMYGSWT